MNKTERKAFEWLLRQGVPKSSIHYQKRKSPDFVLSDGRMIEVKRIVGNTIFFGRKQFEELKRIADKVTVLAFRDESDEPIVIEMRDIEPGKIIDGIKIVVPTRKVSVILDDDLYMRILDYCTRNHIGKVSTAIRFLLVKGLEAMEK